ncbi:tetratricopeptide repeat protein [Actinomycetes bacterium KLBMP 9759]
MLRRGRERMLLTQRQLAERAGLNARTVRRLEQATTISSQQFGSVERLVEVLELDDVERAAVTAAFREGETTRDSDTVVPVPRQLPAAVPLFTGRAAELAELAGAGGAVVITAIDGMAGVGKTALAVQLAHRSSAEFPDGQLFVDLHGHSDTAAPLDPGAALERMLGALVALGERIPSDLDGRAALLRQRLAGKRVLILLDNAASTSQVAPLIPGSSGCLVLITSRHRLTGPVSWRTLSLDVLPQPDAVALLERVLGAERAVAEPSDVLAEIVELCGRLPLAVRLAGARLRARPAWTAQHLADRLRQHHQRLGELQAGERSVAGALALSYHQLTDDQRRSYRLLALHPGVDLDLHAAAALADLDLTQARRTVGDLLDAHLLQEPRPGRYRFHDLVKDHAFAMAESDELAKDRQEARRRLLDHYQHTASRAMDTVYPYEPERRPQLLPSGNPSPSFADGTAAKWLDDELPNLLAAQRMAAADRRGHAVALSAVLRRHLRTRGNYGAAERLHSTALDAAVATGDRHGELEALCGRGPIRRLQGLHDDAVADLGRALAVARELGSRVGQVDALGGLGHVRLMQSRHEEAAADFGAALAVARAADDHNGVRECLTGLGWVNHVRGRPSTAEFIEAIAIARASGYPAVAIPALTGLGHVHRLHERHMEAGAAFEEALRLSVTTGNPIGEIDALLGLGHLHRAGHRRDRAVDCYQRILRRARAIGSRNFQFEALLALGRLQLESGSALGAHAARAALENALALALGLGQAAEQARAHDGLARAAETLGEYERAHRHWRTALKILAELGMERTEDDVSAASIRASIRAAASARESRRGNGEKKAAVGSSGSSSE